MWLYCTEFYLSSHNGRRLAWLTNMGTADLRATFGDGVKRELSVSTYQMCILLLFNTADQAGGLLCICTRPTLNLLNLLPPSARL